MYLTNWICVSLPTTPAPVVFLTEQTDLIGWVWVYLLMLPTALIYRYALRHQRARLDIYDRLTIGWIILWPMLTRFVVGGVFVTVSTTLGSLPTWLFRSEAVIHLLVAAGVIGFIASHSLTEGKRQLLAGLIVATVLAWLCMLIPLKPLQLLGVFAWYVPFCIGLGRAVAAQGRVYGYAKRAPQRDIPKTEIGMGVGTGGWVFEASRIDRDIPAMREPGPTNSGSPAYDEPNPPPA